MFRERRNCFFPLLLSLPLSLFMIVSFKYFHWQFLSRECASFQLCVRGQRSWALQGRAAPGWVGSSSACAVLGRLWQQQCLCSWAREEQQCGINAGADCGKRREQAAAQCSTCAFCQKPTWISQTHLIALYL